MNQEMKRILTTTMITLFVIQTCLGQDPGVRLTRFRTGILPGYGTYFDGADMDESGKLSLRASESYENLAADGKQQIMKGLLGEWRQPLVIVAMETKRELWGWDKETGKASLIDMWDLNPEPPVAETKTDNSPAARHPWFFYIGGAQRMDSQKNINGAINGRVGFFLLRDKWDMALTLSESIAGNFESDELSMTTSAGVMSKVYFPIRKYNISPNAGAEAAVTIPRGGRATFTPSFIVGLSWYVGIGSLDVGLRVGSSSMLMAGYTIIPKFKFKK